MNYGGIIPNIIRSFTIISCRRSCRFDRVVNGSHRFIKRHHPDTRLRLGFSPGTLKTIGENAMSPCTIVFTGYELTTFRARSGNIIEQDSIIVWIYVDDALDHLKDISFIVWITPTETTKQSPVSRDHVVGFSEGPEFPPMRVIETTYNLVLQCNQLAATWAVGWQFFTHVILPILKKYRGREHCFN